MVTRSISKQTLKNWLIDAALFSSAIVAALSGIYFLLLPQGGYMGGRNPYYNIQILFSRHTWDDLHTWGGVAMVVIAVVHLVIHWSWVVSMAKRSFKEITGKGASMNARGRWNWILNVVVALSFLLTALSGIYFLFFPGGHGAVTPDVIFSRTTWKVIHDWAGTIFIALVVVHFIIHRKWVTKVTGKILALVPGFRPVSPTPAVNS